MPSPFPGMDPWLEAPSLWPGLHNRLINESATFLQSQLTPRGYYCDIGERVWLTTSERAIYPDNVVFVRSRAQPGAGSPSGTLIADPPVRVRRVEEEVNELFLEIFAASGDKLVTGLEFLSPVNKEDATGREKYQKKQAGLREGGVHLVEIDLLRRGPHDLDVPRTAVEIMRPWHYLANIVRRGGEGYEVYPIALRTRLPKIGIPLNSGDEDAVLDLQALFETAYDNGPYRVRVDYTEEPVIPLADDDARWADELLRAANLRP
jgi:hypothetical protein